MTRRRIIHYRPITILRGEFMPIGQMLGLFRAVALALPREQKRLACDGDPHPFEIREMQPSYIGDSARQLEQDLRRRLQRVILGYGECMGDWRERFGMRPEQWMRTQRVRVLWRDSWPCIPNPLLFRLGFSPNKIHPVARSVAGIRFRPSTRGWLINLYYGYRNDIEETEQWKRSGQVSSAYLGTGWRLSWETHDHAVGLSDAIRYLHDHEWSVPCGIIRSVAT